MSEEAPKGPLRLGSISIVFLTLSRVLAPTTTDPTYTTQH